GTDGFCFAQKIFRSPSLLFEVTAVPVRHMVRGSGKGMPAVTAFMQGDAFHLVIDLYDIGVVYGRDLFPDVRIGYAVVVPVFSQDNMIIFLYLGPDFMF